MGFRELGERGQEELEKALRASYVLSAGVAEGLIKLVVNNERLGSEEKESCVRMFIESMPRDMLLKVSNDIGIIRV